MPSSVHPERIHVLREAPAGEGPVLYWMQRDQRVRDNWALLHARDLARAAGQPVAVAFCLVPEFLGAPARAYRFMLDGLREVAAELERRGVPFFLLRGDPGRELPALAGRVGAGAVVTDFSPLRPVRGWQEAVARGLRVPLLQVDAHNVVPCRSASDKQEYAARTIRSKLHRRLAEFLDEFPRLGRAPAPWPGEVPRIDWGAAARGLHAAAHGPETDGPPAGEKAARAALRRFVERRLEGYDEGRNDPNRPAQSELSPYLHFGQLAPQRAALAAAGRRAPAADREAFLEQLIVRRELADNYCLHNPRYDSLDGCPDWARRTLAEHADDPREHLYTQGQLERAETHEPLWNAAQREMVLTGKMHGYLRMYWAKQILAWERSPEQAYDVALALNDRYELDGRDPNGYAGVAWSIGGVHDRPWFERPVFGKIRPMSAAGCRRKFDVARYVARIDALARERG